MNTMLEETVAERDSLHAQVSELEHDISEQEQIVADLQASRQDQLNSLSVELESAKLERDQFVNKLNVANSKVASLQEELDRIQARTEQADGRVAEAAKIVEQHQAQVSRLHESNAELQQSVGRLTKLLYIAEQRVVMFEDEVERAQSELHNSTTTLQERLQQQQARQMADSMELGELRKAVDEQRRRLADAQATLVERDVALKQAESKSKEQAQSLERFRQVAGNRIRELEDELADHRQRLQDLSKWLDKRRMRGENVTEKNA
jgi:chromosome segregation ATPase